MGATYICVCHAQECQFALTVCTHGTLRNSCVMCTDDGGRGLASSPGPAQNLGKGPGHTCKNFRMCCVSSLCLEWRNHVCPLPITTFLTREGSRLVPRPLKIGTRLADFS